MNSELSNLNVWYGWSVLNKVRKKIALSVIFENEATYSERKSNQIKRLQHTYFVRKQTIDEANDAESQNRILTEYCTFLFDKPFNGDLMKLVENNLQADINNVSQELLNEIKETLIKGFRNTYNEIRI